jgi:glycosyltransferase involved in cell wall biosynthesis
MKRARLSILIPTISRRSYVAETLFKSLESRIGDLPVELLMLRDNRWQNIGEKRNQLLRAATGDYITFLDDDDELLEGYFELVLPELDKGADVVCYDQEANIDGARGRITCALGNPHEPFVADGVARRPPWFWCAWKRDLAAAYRVPESFVDANGNTHHEDGLWLRHLWVEAKSEARIEAVLHRYNYSSSGTTLQKPLTEAA